MLQVLSKNKTCIPTERRRNRQAHTETQKLVGQAPESKNNYPTVAVLSNENPFYGSFIQGDLN